MYLLKVTKDYMDTSIGKFDNSIVEVLKYHEGTLRFSNPNRGKAKIIKEEYCDIKVSTGEIFCNIPSNWLLEKKQNK